MKKIMTISVIAGLLFSATPILMAGDGDNARLISALTAENIGWRVDAARLLGEAAEAEAVKPLMEVLENDVNSSARMSAAVALAKIGDMTALNALKKAAKFDINKTVRTVANGAYHELKKLDEQIAAK